MAGSRAPQHDAAGKILPADRRDLRLLFALAAARATAQHALDDVRRISRTGVTTTAAELFQDCELADADVDKVQATLDAVQPRLNAVETPVDAGDRACMAGVSLLERSDAHLEVGDLGGEQIDLGVDAAQQRQNEVGGFLDHRRKIAPVRAKAKPLSRSGVTTTAAGLLYDEDAA